MSKITKVSPKSANKGSKFKFCVKVKKRFCKNNKSILKNYRIASGAADGEVRLWDLSRQKCIKIFQGHENRYVRGIVFTPNGQNLLSVGDDKHICTWNLEESLDSDQVEIVKDPTEIINSKAMLTGKKC